MVRAILTAIGGYVLMVILVVSGIAVVWFSMGNAFAFEGETNRASSAWSIAMLGCGLVAAVAAGAFAGCVGGPKAALSIRILIGMVVVLGIISAVAQFTAEPPVLPAGKKVAELTFAEAGACAISPMWYNVAVVFVGIIGIALGGKLTRKSPHVTTAA